MLKIPELKLTISRVIDSIAQEKSKKYEKTKPHAIEHEALI